MINKKYISRTLSAFFVLYFYLMGLHAKAQDRTSENTYGIIPMPLSVEIKKGEPFKICKKTAIIYQNDESKKIAEYLQERIYNATSLKLELTKTFNTNAIVLNISSEKIKFAEKDAYYFESDKDQIEICGKSASGLFYGVQTLFQLLPSQIYSNTVKKNTPLVVDPLIIKDKPMMKKIRGLHVDISRHFRTKQELLKIIDCMVMHKLNYLHLHLSDDDAWRIEMNSFPELTTIGAIGNRGDKNAPAQFYTKADIKEICSYAKSRYVSIIPEVDMPGHMSAILKTYPHLKSKTELRNPGHVMRIDSIGVVFAKTILSEIDSMFNPEYLHIGCDEVNYGLDTLIYDDHELVTFAKEICTFIKKDLQKTPIVWDDVFIDGLVDKETVVQWWRYGKAHWWNDLKHPVDEELNIKKQPFIFSSAYWLYFDMGNLKGGWAKPISASELYNWDPYEDMIGSTEMSRKLTHGAIACTWSEELVTMKDFGIHTFPRITSYSERIWRGGKSDHEAILNWKDYRDKVLIPYQIDRYKALNVYYWSKDDPSILKNLKDVRKKLK